MQIYDYDKSTQYAANAMPCHAKTKMEDFLEKCNMFWKIFKNLAILGKASVRLLEGKRGG